MKNKTQVLLKTILSTLFLGLVSCAHQENSERSPAAVQRNELLDIKVSHYKQQLRTVDGKIVPLHFFKTEAGSWYLALGCAPHPSQGHTFEVYNKAYQDPEKLDAQLRVNLIRDSNSFQNSGDCIKAFEQVTAATTEKPVCLKETHEGVLVSSCRPLHRFERSERNFGSRF